MSKTTHSKDKTELIAGLFTIVLAAGLLYALFVGFGHLRNKLAELSGSIRPTATIPSSQAQATVPTIPKNPFSHGDFVYQNGYLTCLAGESLLGVDVSEYQGVIDWQTVANHNIRFAMVRVGARGWGEAGNIIADAHWEANLDGAAEAGLLTGVYFFSQAISEEEAREEARFVLDKLDGRALQLPVVFDWEIIPSDSARTADMKPDQLNRCAIAFCEEIRAAGYEPMVYFNQDIAYHMLDLNLMYQQAYPFWLAMYTSAMTFPYRVTLWQYTASGTVPGINGLVDLDLYFIYD